MKALLLLLLILTLVVGMYGILVSPLWEAILLCCLLPVAVIMTWRKLRAF